MFTVHMFDGSAIYPVPGSLEDVRVNGLPDGFEFNPIARPLEEGQVVVSVGITGLCVGEVLENREEWFFKTGAMIGKLSLSNDERKCWVYHGLFNSAALRRTL